MVDSYSFNQIIFEEDGVYSVGFNDGREFSRIKYIGTKLLNGKSMLCFKTEESLDLSVNPSYVSFYIKQANTDKKE
jgi:hypothetical protein